MKVRCGNKNCKEYIEKDSAIHSGINYYCDDSCLHARPLSKRKTSAAKRTTKKRRKTKPTLPSTVTESVLSRDGHSCRYCGGTQNLAVHHIYYRSEWKNKPWENERSNLILLCNDHHLNVIHANKKRWQRVCLAYIWLREVEGKLYTLRQIEEMI